MKYIVEVREPVPSNLDEIAGKVAASFHISNDKALALLRRAPGAMTRAVSEREADVVAGIFERAGLIVEKRPADGAPAVEAGAGSAGASAASRAPHASQAEAGADAAAAEQAAPGSGAEAAARDEAAEADAGTDDVWNRPVGGEPAGENPVDSFSRRDGLEDEGAELAWNDAGPSHPEPGHVDAAQLERMQVEPGPAEAAAAEADAIELDDDVHEGMDGGTDRGPGAQARHAWSEEAAAEAGPGSGAMPADMPGRGGAAGEAGAAAAAAAAGASADAMPVGRSSQTPEMMRSSQTPETLRSSRTPEMARRSQTPETMKSTLTRAATTLQRGGLRRRVAMSSILPALLTLVVMGVAMLVTILPLLRSQQLYRAADAAHAEASTIEALTGGMPLDSQTLSPALVDLSQRSQALLGGGGVRLMVVTDATGAALAGWYGAATTPAAMPPGVRQAVSGRALSTVAGQVQGGETLVQSLQASWHSVLAMLGLATAGDVFGAAPVMSAGQPIGAVVVGVSPVSASALVGNAFLTTLLVGLVPVLIAILVAMGLTRGLRAQVSYLLGAADRISRGDLEEPVELDSRDELGQLARAIERMRVSLQEGMERLRRRR
ncbi:MAG: HAMP domain-containing protein [Deinococcales bacterium]